jgi:hypothetical protein
VRTYTGTNYDSEYYLVKDTNRVRIQTRKQHYRKEQKKINPEQVQKDGVGDENRKKLRRSG